jgi:hypothetical protein
MLLARICNYLWRKNGAVLSGKTEATLTITSAQSDDAGTYTVYVYNPYGSFDSPATSIFFILPKFKVVPQTSPSTEVKPRASAFSRKAWNR